LSTPDVRKSFLGNIGAPKVDKRLFLMLIMSQICISDGEVHGGFVLDGTTRADSA
jgi:hypothetical protein